MLVFRYILITIVIFFVWNILKRLFLSVFYPEVISKNTAKESKTKAKTTHKKGIAWDAENVDYEEIDAK
jgi:hypothetical protein